MFKGHIFVLAILLNPVITPAVHAQETVQCSMHMEAVDNAFYVTGDNGVAVSFSDIGCAILMREEMCAMETMKFENSAVVRDFFTGEETLMSAAYYAVGTGVPTPLGTDIVAFANEEDAERFVREKGSGKVMRYNDLLLMKFDPGMAAEK